MSDHHIYYVLKHDTYILHKVSWVQSVDIEKICPPIVVAVTNQTNPTLSFHTLQNEAHEKLIWLLALFTKKICSHMKLTIGRNI